MICFRFASLIIDSVKDLARRLTNETTTKRDKVPVLKFLPPYFKDLKDKVRRQEISLLV